MIRSHETFAWVCCRVRVQAAYALFCIYKSDHAECSEPGGQHEVEEEIMGLESPQSAKGV